MTDQGKKAGLTYRARAKINLYLHVTGKRDDGYHLLDSLMAFADVGDQITALPAKGLSMTIDGPYGEGLPTGPENLVMKAALGLQKLCQVSDGAKIHLTKNLPPASGIGGGSADAAATLRALMALWAITPEETALYELALSLGADVPICLKGRASFVAGIGEDITLAPPLPEGWLVLINPNVEVSTPAVFKARTGAFTPANQFNEQAPDAVGLACLLADRHNDLMAPAIKVAPVVQDCLDALRAEQGCKLARMSGSGATCFGLFAAKTEAEQAAARIAEARPGWWVSPAALLGDARD